MVRIAVLLLAVAACAAAALPALAADPTAATVDAGTPEAKWTGAVPDPVGAAYFAAFQAGSAEDACGPPAEACDSFTLTVAADGATKLTITVRADLAADWVGLSVTGPDGEEHLALNESTQETVVYDAPAAGTYAVTILGSPSEPAPDVPYAGVATLELAPPPPPPSDAPPPPPSGAPAPAAPGEPPPPPPVQAGPRELAVQPDRRRVRRAVLRGFRTRVVCRGGCATLKLRVFVSSLTAKNHRLGKFKGDVHVGGAPVLRDVEGRTEAKVVFNRRARRRLARAKELTLAVEAVARDYDGRERTVVKRIKLRR